MALTSAAGASLTKNYTGAAGTPVPTSFTTPSYCGWLKIPSIGSERLLYDVDGRLQIKLDSAGKFALWLDGALAATGINVQPTNKWIFWTIKKNTSSPNYILQSCFVDCVNNIPTLTSLTIEVSHTQGVAAGSPTKFTFHIPAGCAVCMFIHGNSSVSLPAARFSWNTTVSSNAIWRTPLRFPDDLNDHREISASSGDTTFHGMHQWDSQTGSVTLDVNGDPEHLLDKICSAVIGFNTFGAGIDTAHAPIPYGTPSGTIFNDTVPLPITILTNVLPATAVIDRVTVGGRGSTFDPGTGAPFAFQDNWGFYRRTPDLTVYGPYQFAGEQFGFYDWTFFGAPSGVNAPAGVNPSTGLPWTLADYYASIWYASCMWFSGGGVGNITCLTLRTFEAGIGVLYFGQTTPGVCGGGPPPVQVGTIVVNKIVIPDNGEEFTFNAVGLTPNAFILGGGDSIQYDNVPIGSGYGINELVPPGWQVTYLVSNGSPHDNISVGVGEVVVVNVTNVKLPNELSGIYKIVPGKRQDTLWLENFVGTRNVKIP